MSEVDILRKELAELKKMMMTGNRQYCSSVSDDDKKPVEFDPHQLINNVFTKMIPISGNNILVIELLKMAYATNPEAFVPQGSIHTSPDGSKTYVSLKVYLNPSYNFAVHINGVWRFEKFRMTTMDVYYKNKTGYETYTYSYMRDRLFNPLN